jgi:hypothetical protein
MKIDFFGPHRARAISAILRNGLTGERAPEACPVRKCRRDGVCSGPLAAATGEHVRLATGPDDAGSDIIPIPVCWFALSQAQMARIRTEAVDTLRTLDRHLDATVIETTRALSGRRWKRLG